MKRILFVDDEPKVLEGLQRLLRPERHEWDLLFAVGGLEALSILEKTNIDVVVADMRMPGMDGAALLHRVQERFPNVMRIVLSGHFDVEAGLQAVPVAHQFLIKPCDPGKLRAAIERSSHGATLPDEATRRVVSAVGSLPSPSHACMMLTKAIQDPRVSMDTIGRLINQDVAIAAKVLQLVNSAFFSLAHQVSDVQTAVSLLGLDVIRQLVFSAEILKVFHPARPIPGFSLDAFQRHCQLTARIAARLPARGGISTFRGMAGLLHDSGTLVLASRFPSRFEKASGLCRKDGCSHYQAEKVVFGTSHAEVGAYLLNLWGLPQPIVRAIGSHHAPAAESSSEGLDLPAVVYIADALAHELALPAADLPPVPVGIDPGYIAALGMTGQIEGWRAAARRFATQEPS